MPQRDSAAPTKEPDAHHDPRADRFAGPWPPRLFLDRCSGGIATRRGGRGNTGASSPRPARPVPRVGAARASECHGGVCALGDAVHTLGCAWGTRGACGRARWRRHGRCLVRRQHASRLAFGARDRALASKRDHRVARACGAARGAVAVVPDLARRVCRLARRSRDRREEHGLTRRVLGMGQRACLGEGAVGAHLGGIRADGSAS